MRWDSSSRSAGLFIISLTFAVGLIVFPAAATASAPTLSPAGAMNTPTPATLAVPTRPVVIAVTAQPCTAPACPATANAGTVALFSPVRDLAIITTETTARFMFDTVTDAQVALRADNQRPVEVFSHFADESAPTTHHDLTLANLVPWSGYRYTIAFSGETSTAATGIFGTQPVAIANVRVQPDTASVQIWFDTAVPADAVVRIRSTADAYHVDIPLPQAYRAWLQQPGLRPGTTYTFTITISDQEAYAGSFGTDTAIDSGPALNPAGG